MTVAVRFAPSPTGRLQVGNIRSALFNYLFARAAGGSFMLRLDDTDTERSTAEFARAIEEDLAWLGLAHDRFARQSERVASYVAAAERLKAAGRLYPAYETADELERKRRLQRTRGLPPVYDRAALKLSDVERAALESQGRKPHWRFRLTGEDVVFHDLIRGEQAIATSSLSDPVLIREDGSFLYTLPSIVDDIEFGITHVIRGEDHVANTGAQIEIFDALHGAVPVFAHHSLFTDTEGAKLSKRTESLSIESLRARGVEPLAVLSLLARLGTSDAVEAADSIEELVATFSFEKVGRAPARFDMAELDALNAKVLHRRGFAEVAERLAVMGVGGGEAFWRAVQPNIATLDEAKEWWRVVAGPLDPAIAEPDFCLAAADLLPPEPWDEGTWALWTGQIKAKTGRKGRELFQPLRQALTGLSHGPEMKSLLPLLGREKALARLQGLRS